MFAPSLCFLLLCGLFFLSLFYLAWLGLASTRVEIGPLKLLANKPDPNPSQSNPITPSHSHNTINIIIHTTATCTERHNNIIIVTLPSLRAPPRFPSLPDAVHVNSNRGRLSLSLSPTTSPSTTTRTIRGVSAGRRRKNSSNELSGQSVFVLL